MEDGELTAAEVYQEVPVAARMHDDNYLIINGIPHTVWPPPMGITPINAKDIYDAFDSYLPHLVVVDGRVFSDGYVTLCESCEGKCYHDGGHGPHYCSEHGGPDFDTADARWLRGRVL